MFPKGFSCFKGLGILALCPWLYPNHRLRVLRVGLCPWLYPNYCLRVLEIISKSIHAKPAQTDADYQSRCSQMKSNDVYVMYIMYITYIMYIAIGGETVSCLL